MSHLALRNLRRHWERDASCQLQMQNDISTAKHMSCYGRLHVKDAVRIVASLSAFFITANLVMKIAGYSETEWDWELLFLLTDGIAVLSLIYGIYKQKPAYLQPFVALSIITTSFLILLGIYLASAIYNPNSYAGQDLEIELHKRLSLTTQKLSMQFTMVLPIVAISAFTCILLAASLHCWFVYTTVCCARYFREESVKT